MNFGFGQIGVGNFIDNMAAEKGILITWTAKTDENGDVVLTDRGNKTWEENRQEINLLSSYQTSTKVPVKINSETGQYRSFDYEFFTSDVLNLEVSVTEKPPELIHRGRRHRIHETETAPIGVMRMVCEQVRTGNV